VRLVCGASRRNHTQYARDFRRSWELEFGFHTVTNLSRIAADRFIQSKPEFFPSPKRYLSLGRTKSAHGARKAKRDADKQGVN
jgi:hypothetical protein